MVNPRRFRAEQCSPPVRRLSGRRLFSPERNPHQTRCAWDTLAQARAAARALAAQLSYKGLKWGKSVGPEGRSAPWVGNQVLLWKQPHPIFFAELEYRLRPTRETLEKWADIVQGTAQHMADYPARDDRTGVYSLVPVMPPSE
jgi:hypothetical protein